jgi:hypothetical protein
MFTMRTGHTGLRPRNSKSEQRLWISAYEQSRWIRLRGGFNTIHSQIKRLYGKEHLVRHGQDVSMRAPLCE